MKNILLCCDGTNNQVSGDDTNVLRLYRVAAKLPGQQIAFYDPGVGTMADSRYRTELGQRWSMLKGLGFGSGFIENISDAYRYLMYHYEPGDRVYLSGFSRGAFTVRSIGAPDPP